MLLKQMLVRNTCKCLLRGEGMDLKGIINFSAVAAAAGSSIEVSQSGSPAPFSIPLTYHIYLVSSHSLLVVLIEVLLSVTVA